MTTWHDKFGFIHLTPNPDPEQSENAPLFTGTNITLHEWRGTLTLPISYAFLDSVSKLIKDGDWYTTPVSVVKRFSRDNFAGVISGLKSIIRYAKKMNNSHLENKAKKLLKQVPLFHRQLIHPRDFVMVGYAKYPWLFFPLLPILTISLIVSCWQTHKVRNGNKIAKTDGKIIALILSYSMCLVLTHLICVWLIKNKKRKRPKPSTGSDYSGNTWKWDKLWAIFYDYFRRGDHPNAVLINRIEINVRK
jgi:hypothetical protein